MVKQFFKDRRIQGGLTYEEFVALMERSTYEADESSLEGEDLERAQYTKLNIHRTRRIAKTFVVPEAVKVAVESISSPQLWMVLTEAWCGDSAQSLPLIAKTATCNPLISMRILLRDENLDIIDQYLTDGTRAIPKLVALNQDGDELFQWGPRPKEAAELFRREKQAGLEKEQIMEKLHLWYGRDRGKAIVEELLAALRTASGTSASGG